MASILAVILDNDQDWTPVYVQYIGAGLLLVFFVAAEVVLRVSSGSDVEALSPGVVAVVDAPEAVDEDVIMITTAAGDAGVVEADHGASGGVALVGDVVLVEMEPVVDDGDTPPLESDPAV